MYRELLTFDIYLREKMKTRPAFAKSQDALKDVSRELYQREEPVSLNLLSFQLCQPWRPFLARLITRDGATLSRFSFVQLCASRWMVAHQTPLSMGFSRQEYWSGKNALLQGSFPNPGIKPTSPALQMNSLPLAPLGKTHERW